MISSSAPDYSTSPHGYAVPLMYVTTLFFLWGLAYGLLDVLNKHFQETLHVGKANSGWLQAAYFGAYFVASFPAGVMMQRWGYKAGIIVGLVLYAAGAFLFIPAALHASFVAFLGALFVLACGLSCLETAANPYVTILGAPETAARRLNLSQSFNGLGSFIGPLLGGALFFSATSPGTSGALSAVSRIYAVIGAIVLCVAWGFSRLTLPEIQARRESSKNITGRLRDRPHFVFGVLTQFFYVAAQVGVGAFFINFATEHWRGLTSQRGAYLLSIGLLCFLLGRFMSTALMVRASAQRILLIYSAACTVLALVVACGIDKLSVVALIAMFFFMSIMFPTIFSLGLKDLGPLTTRGASYMVASIVGGALLPYVMGAVAEHSSTAVAYLLPAACFCIVFLYAWRGFRVR